VGIYTKWLGAGGALTNAGQAINSHAIHTIIHPHSRQQQQQQQQCLNQRPMSVTILVGVLTKSEKSYTISCACSDGSACQGKAWTNHLTFPFVEHMS
jgi:hypothetical protein